MSKIKCSCGCEEDVEWKISAWHLIEAEISFNCPKCKKKNSFRIIFPEKKGDEIKIVEDETSYIG